MGKQSRRLRRWSESRPAKVLGGVVMSAAAVVVLIFVLDVLFGQEPLPSIPSGQTVDNYAEEEPAPLPPVDLPDNPRVMVLGDSWSVGYAAPPGQGYVDVAAQTLGWDATVIPDGSGTGFMNRGPTGAGTYLERLTPMPVDPEVDLLLIQGGLNDETGDVGLALNDAIESTIKLGRKKYPNAEVVVVGPLYPLSSLASSKIQTIDSRLGFSTDLLRVHYISPELGTWFENQADIDKYIDKSKTNHPNAAGHAHFAEHLVREIRRLS